jgi:flagellar motor protein MotB
VDYSSPETGKALETIFNERFGADALKAIKADLKATEDKSKKEAAAVSKTVAPESEAQDPGELAKILFARLADAEPMGEPELAKLADARAQAIVSELSEAGKIPTERVQVKPSTALEKGDAVTAALNLEARR